MAGIFGGLQSLHTDAYDEALSCPTQFGARIAVATQNILREEAHLTDVIDPLGGSYYVETLTDEMEAAILRSMREVEDAGGMYAAVEAGLVQRQIGESARRFQDERRIRRADGRRRQRVPRRRGPERAAGAAEAGRAADARRTSTRSARTRRSARRRASARRWTRSPAPPTSSGDNMFAQVVAAAEAGCTHGEICGTLRREMGFGHVLALGRDARCCR